MYNAFKQLPPFAQIILILLVYAALVAIALVVAPQERTLGAGIRTVYLHVALMWVGMVGIYVAGLVGLIVGLFGRSDFFAWMRLIGMVALAFYVGGSLASIAAQVVNWGGIALAEPRTLAALQVIAAGVVVVVLAAWNLNHRVVGALFFAWALFTVYVTRSTTLILHPDDPIGTSSALGIQAMFYGLFGLTLFAAIAVIAILRPDKTP